MSPSKDFLERRRHENNILWSSTIVTWLCIVINLSFSVVVGEIGANSIGLLKQHGGVSCPTDEIIHWIEMRDLSMARYFCLHGYTQFPQCKEAIIKAYKFNSDRILSTVIESDDSKSLNVLPFFFQKDYNSSSVIMRRPTANHDSPSCIANKNGGIGALGEPTLEWDQCCSILPQKQDDEKSSFFIETSSLVGHESSSACGHDNPCCEFFPGSHAHLRLPALHEPAIRIRISTFSSSAMKQQVKTLDLEQDGYLRPFDVSAILWPSGYLLTQCLSNPIACEIPEIHQAIGEHPDSGSPLAIELGTGIGAASIAFALHLEEYLKATSIQSTRRNALIVCTDIAPHALALTAANAHWNGASSSIIVQLMNHTNFTSVARVQAEYFPNGISVVFGSSLQRIFHETHKSDESLLWKLLDKLFASNNSEAVAVFVHTKTERLLPPDDGTFFVAKRIDGDKFGMTTRTGSSSDFEVSVFKRRTEAVVEQGEL